MTATRRRGGGGVVTVGRDRRIPWERLPAHVRRAVERSLGAGVVEVRTQESGFSPGAAARLRLSNGGTAFVKALSTDIHPSSVRLYRWEAATMPHLPADAPVPRLLDAYDDGTWVALVFEDIEGRHPTLPWRADELARVAATVGELAVRLRPTPWPEAPAFAEMKGNAPFMGAWQELLAAPPPDLDPWLHERLERLARDGPSLAKVVVGDTLLNTDIRSDNLLLTPAGRVVVLDWGWTCNGAPWLDLALFLMWMATEGGPDPDALIRTHPLTRDVDPTWIDALLLASLGVYWPNRARATATLTWLRHRSRS